LWTCKVEFSTSFSGEEAVRLTAAHHFDVITVDEMLSEDYCKRLNLFFLLVSLNRKLNIQKISYKMHRENAMLHTSPTRAEKLGPCGLIEESVHDSIIRSSTSVPSVIFDVDRLSSSKQRKQFFEEEGFNHEVRSHLFHSTILH
jgi:hypothetical protein